MAKRWQSSWKTHWNYRGIEFHEFVGERGQLFRLQSSQARDDVTRGPAPYKNWTKLLFWKSIVAGKKLQEKLQKAVCCQFFQGRVELLKNVSIKSWLGSPWLVCCENENGPLQITNKAFSTPERIEQSRAFEINCSSVVGFRFQLFLLCHYCCPFSGMHQHWQLWGYNRDLKIPRYWCTGTGSVPVHVKCSCAWLFRLRYPKNKHAKLTLYMHVA